MSPPSSHATDALLSHAYARVQYFAVVGVTPHRHDHARCALGFALDLQTAAAAVDLRPSGGGALRLRIGLALGPVVAEFADAPRRRLRVTGDAGAAAIASLPLLPPSCVLLPSRASRARPRSGRCVVDGGVVFARMRAAVRRVLRRVPPAARRGHGEGRTRGRRWVAHHVHYWPCGGTFFFRFSLRFPF